MSQELGLTTEEKEDESFALRHLSAQPHHVIFFSEKVRRAENVMSLMFSKSKVRQEYINEIWEIDSERVVNFLNKNMRSIPSLKKEIKNDERVLKILINKMNHFKFLELFREEEHENTFGKIDLVIEMLNANSSNNKVLSIFVQHHKFKTFFQKANEQNKLEDIKKIIDEYKGGISVTLVKVFLKNQGFKDFFGETYKENLQKDDYRPIIREMFLVQKINEIEESASNQKLQRKKNKI